MTEVDLKLSPALAERIFVTVPGDPAALAKALNEAIASVMNNGIGTPLPGADRALLSWAAYGRRYFEELCRYNTSPTI